MNRKFYDELNSWKNSKNGVPLMVVGARQVGKTYIINKFCQENYKNYYYLNFMREKEFVKLFKEIESFDRRVEALESLVGGSIRNDNDTVLFVDEVQESEEFIEALKFFNESIDTYNIVCAGSLLGVALKRLHSSFPVGKVKVVNMYPMDFEEFLVATKNARFIKLIKDSFNTDTALALPIHNKMLDLFYKYLYLGGMPSVVKNFLEVGMDLALVDSDILSQIINAYFDDMSKYADPKEVIRIRNLYKSIPSQLAKENQKFIFSEIDKNDNRKRDYVTALDWLMASNLVLSCNLVVKPEYPLKGFVDNDTYKLYLSDTGILNNMLNISKKNFFLDGTFSYKGLIAENYVACELTKMGYDLFYWSRKGKNNGNAEIDFVIQMEDCVVPLEVKANDNTQAKSLKVYNSFYNPVSAIKISSNNFNKYDNIKCIPLYAVFCLSNKEC